MSDEVLRDQVDRLWLVPESDLYSTLAINQQAIEEAKLQNDVAQLEQAQQYDAVFAADDTEMGVLSTLQDAGRQWWERLEPKLHDVLCNKDNKQHGDLIKALGEGGRMLAAALAPALVAQAALLPAAAVVVATIAAKKIYEAGLETTCDLWAKSLQRRAAAAQALDVSQPAAQGG